ncbi:MAG: hypothetical protein JWM95_1998 [Gemmatimonadetes bacterium]|nr:hypothetical protein [Gemmatimonadota bacterium]
MLRAAIVLVAMPMVLVAQVAMVGIGSRVRIMVAGSNDWQPQGVVTRVTGDAIDVDSIAVSRSKIAQIEMSIGTERHTLQGLGLGVILGAGAGAVLGYSSGDDQCAPKSGEYSCFLLLTRRAKAVLLGGVMGVAGGLIGTIVGASHKTDIWIPATSRLAIRPFVGSSSAGLSLSF